MSGLYFKMRKLTFRSSLLFFILDLLSFRIVWFRFVISSKHCLVEVNLLTAFSPMRLRANEELWNTWYAGTGDLNVHLLKEWTSFLWIYRCLNADEPRTNWIKLKWLYVKFIDLPTHTHRWCVKVGELLKNRIKPEWFYVKFVSDLPVFKYR